VRPEEVSNISPFHPVLAFTATGANARPLNRPLWLARWLGHRDFHRRGHHCHSRRHLRKGDRHLFVTHPVGNRLLSGGSDGPEGSLLGLTALLGLILIIRFTTRTVAQPTLRSA
jgi:hypothetical protein